MARNGDVGPYSVSNVRICLFTENIAEARSLQPERFQIVQLGSGRGWTKRKSGKRPYQVVVADKYVGVFASQAEAEAAYALEVARVSHAANCFAPL